MRVEPDDVRTNTVTSRDGTCIAYHSVGQGRGLVIVGGVLSAGLDYLPLARCLAAEYEVHIMERRGRPGSGPQGPAHSLDDECADLAAVVAATSSMAVFGHSFGGMVALETARRETIFDHLFVYEPGVPVRGMLCLDWLDGYERLLTSGDRRGAFAWMVKHAGHAPPPIRILPLCLVRPLLRLGIRGAQWKTIDSLLNENLVEHRILAALDAPTAARFSTVKAQTLLLGGARSPHASSGSLLYELDDVIRSSRVAVLPGIGHAAPQDQAPQVAAALLARVG